jgi:hypothetical protein
MKTEEDEAFDELAKRQGDWGGGYQAKRKMAADKLQDGKCKYCVDGCIACDALAQPAQEPRQWIWLSDADIRETIDSICQYNGDYDEFLCKKIERKIKELNT